MIMIKENEERDCESLLNARLCSDRFPILTHERTSIIATHWKL